MASTPPTPQCWSCFRPKWGRRKLCQNRRRLPQNVYLFKQSGHTKPLRKNNTNNRCVVILNHYVSSHKHCVYSNCNGKQLCWPHVYQGYSPKLYIRQNHFVCTQNHKNSKNLDNELGYHPLLSTKNSKNIERSLFLCAKIKTRTLSKNVKIDPQKYVLQGFPPSTIYKNSKIIERILF